MPAPRQKTYCFLFGILWLNEISLLSVREDVGFYVMSLR